MVVLGTPQNYSQCQKWRGRVGDCALKLCRFTPGTLPPLRTVVYLLVFFSIGIEGNFNYLCIYFISYWSSFTSLWGKILLLFVFCNWKMCGDNDLWGKWDVKMDFKHRFLDYRSIFPKIISTLGFWAIVCIYFQSKPSEILQKHSIL